jgi:hypothetical protein
LWRKAAEPLEAKWAEGVKAKGVDAAAAMAGLKGELKKAGADY